MSADSARQRALAVLLLLALLCTAVHGADTANADDAVPQLVVGADGVGFAPRPPPPTPPKLAPATPSQLDQVYLLPAHDGVYLMVAFVWTGSRRLRQPVVRYEVPEGTREAYDFNVTTVTENGYVGTVHTAIVPAATEAFTVGDLDLNIWSVRHEVRARPPLYPIRRPDSSGLSRAAGPITFAVVGDIDVRPTSRHLVSKLRSDPTPYQLFVIPGDTSYARPEPPRWDVWGRQMEAVLGGIPALVASGNHEFDFQPLAQNFLARFPRPPNSDPSSTALWYSIRYGPVHFVLLTSGTDGMPDPSGSILPYRSIRVAQRSWLRGDLARANTPEARQQYPWIVVVIHQPLFTSGVHVPEPALVADLKPLFESAQVDVIISGHNHGFEVSRPFGEPTLALERDPGPVYVVVGTGGFGGHPLPPSPAPWAQYQAAGIRFGYLRVTADLQSMRLEFLPLYRDNAGENGAGFGADDDVLHSQTVEFAWTMRVGMQARIVAAHGQYVTERAGRLRAVTCLALALALAAFWYFGGLEWLALRMCRQATRLAAAASAAKAAVSVRLGLRAARTA